MIGLLYSHITIPYLRLIKTESFDNAILAF